MHQVLKTLGQDKI